MVDLLTVNLLLNSDFSTPGTKFMTTDKRDFCLNTPMFCYEYMCLNLADLLVNFVQLHNLAYKVTKDG